MSNPAKILVVDDDPITIKNLKRLLEREGHDVLATVDGQEALRVLDAPGFDLVLADLVMAPVGGLEILEQAKRTDPDTEVIIITGHGSVDSAIEAMKRRAFHYVEKPVRVDEVRHLVRQALEKRGLKAQVSALRRQIEPENLGLIGQSETIREIQRLIRQIAQTDSNVLITGESGTGKELAASAIHKLSRRSMRKFMPVNCASFTEELLANELFGHEKDAYTGATSSRPGLLESADGGTVFFDEVGDMSLAMQAKLLRVIQERELFRVGGSKPVRIDVRIVAATNRDLKKAMGLGVFRQDLYFRLNVVPLHMPSLAERKPDIPLLARHFLDRFNARAVRPIAGFSGAAMELLASYDYPGNVRELENIVERAASLARSEIIDVPDLPEDLRDIEVKTFHRDGSRIKTLKEMEDEYIEWVLDRCGHNKSQAADALGINRVSLYRRSRKSQLKD